MSELITDPEELGKAWLRKHAPTRAEEKVFPSGLKYTDVIGWDRFLAAWHLDRKEGSLTPAYIVALKLFVLQWKLEGQGGFDVPLQVRNKVTGEIMEIPCTTDKMPDFTYNKDGVKNIEDLFLTYQQWMDAVADLKLNMSGPSHGSAKYEMDSMGEVVDASEDVVLADLDGLEAINKALE